MLMVMTTSADLWVTNYMYHYINSALFSDTWTNTPVGYYVLTHGL